MYVCWRSHCQIFKLSLCYLSNWRGGGIITDCKNVKFIFFICVFVYGGLLQTPERKWNVTWIFVSVVLTKKKKNFWSQTALLKKSWNTVYRYWCDYNNQMHRGLEFGNSFLPNGCMWQGCLFITVNIAEIQNKV